MATPVPIPEQSQSHPQLTQPPQNLHHCDSNQLQDPNNTSQKNDFQDNARSLSHKRPQLQERDIIAEILILPQSPKAKVDSKKFFRDSSIIVEETLQKIDPAKDLVLIIINSRNSNSRRSSGGHEERACCSNSVLSSIQNHFKLLPTFAVTIEGNPSIHFDYVPDAGAAEVPSSTSLDFHYALLAPWLSPYEVRGSRTSDTLASSILNYTRLNLKGLPTFTMFVNVPESINENVKQKWRDSVQHSLKRLHHPLYDHHVVFEHSLHYLRKRMTALQIIKLISADLRLGIHLESATGDTNKTMTNFQGFMENLSEYQFCLGAAQKTVHELREEIDIFERHYLHPLRLSKFENDSTSPIDNPISMIWIRNIMRQFHTMEEKLKDLAQRGRATHAIVLSSIAQRDSGALARNTEKMAIMANATEKSGQEIHEMTKRMENDARQMKFLAEITAFFLPLTALATFFSMDFVSISEDSGPGPIPKLQNIRFIWIYFVTLVITSMVVFGWWYYKRVSLADKKPTAAMLDEANENNIGGNMGQQAQAIRARAREKIKEIAKRLQKLKDLEEEDPEEEDPEEEDPKEEDWDEMFNQLLQAHMVAEGLNVDLDP